MGSLQAFYNYAIAVKEGDRDSMLVAQQAYNAANSRLESEFSGGKKKSTKKKTNTKKR